MILINDGEFIVGSTWVVGYEPTGKNSVKNKGGLWLNEIGMEDTKKETTMIDLSNAEVLDKFVMANGDVTQLVAKGKNYATKDSDGILMLHKKNGKCDEYKGGSTDLETEYDIVSKYEPRHWLKDLPDADFFELYGSEYISCAKTGDWYADSSELDMPVMFLNKDKMPKLTGDEWKQSKISIADLREWQKANG